MVLVECDRLLNVRAINWLEVFQALNFHVQFQSKSATELLDYPSVL